MASGTTQGKPFGDARLLLVHTVLEDTIDKLDIVSHLKPIHGKEIVENNTASSILAERKQVEQQYIKMMEQRQRGSGTLTRSKALEEKAEVAELSIKLKNFDKLMQTRLRHEKATNILALSKIRREKTRVLNVLQRTAEEIASGEGCETLYGIIQKVEMCS